MFRYLMYGVLPLVGLFMLVERKTGEGWAAPAFVLLALALPFVAVGWLAYQHFRHRP